MTGTVRAFGRRRNRIQPITTQSVVTVIILPMNSVGFVDSSVGSVCFVGAGVPRRLNLVGLVDSGVLGAKCTCGEASCSFL